MGFFCSVGGFFPLPPRATLSHSSKRSYSPLLKRAVVLWNRRVGERRFESSRLVCPGIRFLPINWDWQGLSAAGSLAVVPVVPRMAFAAPVRSSRPHVFLQGRKMEMKRGSVACPQARWPVPGRRRRLSEVSACAAGGFVGR